MNQTLNKEIILQKLADYKATLIEFGIQEIGLFGSYVCDQANSKSDIDLLVDIRKEKKTLRNYLKIVYFLEDLFSRKVELVTKQSLSKHIGPHILATVEYVSIAGWVFKHILDECNYLIKEYQQNNFEEFLQNERLAKLFAEV